MPALELWVTVKSGCGGPAPGPALLSGEPQEQGVRSAECWQTARKSSGPAVWEPILSGVCLWEAPGRTLLEIVSRVALLSSYNIEGEMA